MATIVIKVINNKIYFTGHHELILYVVEGFFSMLLCVHNGGIDFICLLRVPLSVALCSQSGPSWTDFMCAC